MLEETFVYKYLDENGWVDAPMSVGEAQKIWKAIDYLEPNIRFRSPKNGEEYELDLIRHMQVNVGTKYERPIRMPPHKRRYTVPSAFRVEIYRSGSQTWEQLSGVVGTSLFTAMYNGYKELKIHVNDVEYVYHKRAENYKCLSWETPSGGLKEEAVRLLDIPEGDKYVLWHTTGDALTVEGGVAVLSHCEWRGHGLEECKAGETVTHYYYPDHPWYISNSSFPDAWRENPEVSFNQNKPCSLYSVPYKSTLYDRVSRLIETDAPGYELVALFQLAPLSSFVAFGIELKRQINWKKKVKVHGMWHTAPGACIDSILQYGGLTTRPPSKTNGNVHGQGIYFGTKISTALTFAKEGPNKLINVFHVLCAIGETVPTNPGQASAHDGHGGHHWGCAPGGDIMVCYDERQTLLALYATLKLKRK